MNIQIDSMSAKPPLWGSLRTWLILLLLVYLASGGHPLALRIPANSLLDIQKPDKNMSRVAVEGWITYDKAAELCKLAGQDLAALKKAFRGNAIVFSRTGRGCPWIALDDSWAEPEKHVNSGRRSDLRRARRNAEKIGRVTFEILSPTREELPSLLQEVYRVEAAGWKGRDKTAMLHDQRLGEFYWRDWTGKLPSTPAPARRALEAPLDSPPYPSTDWGYGGSPLIGVPDTNVYPLMIRDKE